MLLCVKLSCKFILMLTRKCGNIVEVFAFWKQLLVLNAMYRKKHAEIIPVFLFYLLKS